MWQKESEQSRRRLKADKDRGSSVDGSNSVTQAVGLLRSSRGTQDPCPSSASLIPAGLVSLLLSSTPTYQRKAMEENTFRKAGGLPARVLIIRSY